MIKNKYIKFIVAFFSLILMVIFNLKIDIIRAAGSNLIHNPSVETVASTGNTPEGWYKDFFGKNTRTFSYPVAGQDGNNAMKIEIKKYTSGDAKWVFTDVPINGGQKYEFSDYYQSNVKSYLVVRYLYKSGVYRYFDLATLDPVSNWTQTKLELTTPKNAVSATVYHLIKSVGWLTTDSFYLGQSNVMPTILPTIISTPTPTTNPTITENPTPIPTTEPTITETPEITPTDTPEPTTVPTEVPTPTVEPTITINPEPTITLIPTVDPTITENPTPIPTTEPTITETPEITPTDTPEPTTVPTEVPTPTVEPTITINPEPTPTIINTPTPTPIINNPEPTYSGLILNGNFESINTSNSLPVGWLQGNWGTNNVIFSYPVTGHNSERAAKVELTSLTDGDAKWYFEDVAVTSNSNYIFSDYSIANTPTRIVTRYKLNDGSFVYQEMATVNGSDSWQLNNININPPAGVVSMTVFHLIDKIGTLTIDNASLTKEANPNALTTGMVSLDFDDGWDSTLQNGLPIVNAAGYNSTLYVISRYIGDPGYASLEQIAQAKVQGHEIGAHSKTHPQLPLLTDDEMRSEIIGSKEDLINLGLGPINSFSYPYGEYNNTALTLVNEAGYQSARTALIQDSGFNDRSTNTKLLKTMSVENNTTIEQIKDWIDTAIENKTWLILVMHQIDNSGMEYSITPQKLQQIVDYLKTNNVPVVTVSEGLSNLQ